MTEAIDARFLRSMLYEPLPGSAAVILTQLGIIEEGQIEALGARTYDAESARLSLSLNDGRTVELERAMHLHTENGYAVRIRSRAGQTISRSFIHIDRDLGVRNLYNDRMVYINDTDYTPNAAQNAQESEPSEAEIEAAADAAHEAQLHASGKDELPLETHAETFTVPVDSHGADSVQADSHQPAVPETVPEAKAPAIPVPEVVNFIGEFAFTAETTASPASAAAEDTSAPALDTHPDPASESPSEMLEILPDPDLATILYFHEATIPEDPEVRAADMAPTEFQIHAAPEAPQVVASDQDEAASLEQTGEQATPPAVAEPHTPLSTAEAYELHPDYAPLHAALTPAEAADFLFIAQTGTIYTYEHRQTFRFIHIDAPSGLFYDQTRTPISRYAALKRALTPQPGQPPIVSATPEPELSSQTPAAAESQNPLEIAPPQAIKTEAKTEAKLEFQPAPQPATSTPTPPEPELRVRTTYAARAAVKPEPLTDSDSPLTPSDHAPSFDAFTRKHGSPLDRDSWRDRVAGLRRALRPGRNPNGSNSNSDS